jgi:ubiquinone/menaquinone biosynthesis C-methylase UbiE
MIPKKTVTTQSFRKRSWRVLLIFVFALAVFGGCAALKQCAYEGLSRDEWQQPQKVIQSLQIRPGDAIADLGAGSGYFTFHLAKAAGSAGKVYAVDIDKDMTRLLANKAKDQGTQNVEVILAKPDDSLLPDGSIDLIFTSNVYHHIENRVRYFAALRKSLRPGGRVAIIEYDRRSWFGGLLRHYTPSEFIRREMEQAGYRLAREFDFLDRQSFLLFEQPQVGSKFKGQSGAPRPYGRGTSPHTS